MRVGGAGGGPHQDCVVPGETLLALLVLFGAVCLGETCAVLWGLGGCLLGLLLVWWCASIGAASLVFHHATDSHNTTVVPLLRSLMHGQTTR